jgi:hypothetical protein
MNINYIVFYFSAVSFFLMPVKVLRRFLNVQV